MTEIAEKTHADFVLPSNLVSKIDVSRMVNEVERVDNDLTTAAVRAESGKPQAKIMVSTQLSDFLVKNGLNLNDTHVRTNLIKQLRLMKEKLPVIHMTFAVPADAESLQSLVEWLRTSVHPQAVLSVGLQPALVAGVYMRTPNHVHDLSLRALLEDSHDLLVKELGALRARG